MFKLLALLVIVKAEMFYALIDNGMYVYGELGTCISAAGLKLKCTKIDSKSVKCNSYKDTLCKDVDEEGEVAAVFTEPAMKYKLTVYRDALCDSKIEIGILINDKTVVEKLNECYIDEDDQIPYKWICGKGFKLENGDCVVSGGGDGDVKKYGDSKGCESGSKQVTEACYNNGITDSAFIYECTSCKNGYKKESVTVCGKSHDYCTYTGEDGGNGGNDGPETAGSLAICILFVGLLMILI